MTTLVTGRVAVRATAFERALLGVSRALAAYVTGRARRRGAASHRQLAARQAHIDRERLLTEAYVAHGLLPR